jgi:hypothetical protein
VAGAVAVTDGVPFGDDLLAITPSALAKMGAIAREETDIKTVKRKAKNERMDIPQ